jgi:hypothetical protein
MKRINLPLISGIVQIAPSLVRIDESTRMITQPLQAYPHLALGDTGNASMVVDDGKRTIIFSEKIVNSIKKTWGLKSSQSKYLDTANAIFILHEVCHISQGLTSHSDVQGIKRINLENGREQMAELDLQADFLAVHVLSLLQTKIQNGEKNDKIYIRYFYENWCVVCRTMLGYPPPKSRKDKLQRYFGYLLMAYLISKAYLENRPIPFNGELFPQWDKNFKWLTIKSNGYPYCSGVSVKPVLMKQIMNNICSGNYNAAQAEIAQIWRQLPNHY